MDKFIAGFAVGFFTLLILLGVVPTSIVNQANEAIHECEKSLPRDQHCKIIGIKVDKE